MTKDPRIIAELEWARSRFANLLEESGYEDAARPEAIVEEMALLYDPFKERFGGKRVDDDVIRFAHAVGDFARKAGVTKFFETTPPLRVNISNAFINFCASGRVFLKFEKPEEPIAPAPVRPTRPAKPSAPAPVEAAKLAESSERARARAERLARFPAPVRAKATEPAVSTSHQRPTKLAKPAATIKLRERKSAASSKRASAEATGSEEGDDWKERLAATIKRVTEDSRRRDEIVSYWKEVLAHFSTAAAMYEDSLSIAYFNKLHRQLYSVSADDEGSLSRFTALLMSDWTANAIDALLERSERWTCVHLSNAVQGATEMIGKAVEAGSFSLARDATESLRPLIEGGEFHYRRVERIKLGLGMAGETLASRSKSKEANYIRRMWEDSTERYRRRVWKFHDAKFVPVMISNMFRLSERETLVDFGESWATGIGSIDWLSAGGIAERAIKNAAVVAYGQKAFELSGDLQKRVPSDKSVPLYMILFEFALNAERAFERKELEKNSDAIVVDAQVNDGEYRVSLRDRGMGIKDVERAKLRGTRERPDLFTGAGMGLPRAIELAESNGWRVEIESEPGVGTTATIVMGLTPDGVIVTEEPDVVLPSPQLDLLAPDACIEDSLSQAVMATQVGVASLIGRPA